MDYSCARLSGGNRDRLFCICDIAPVIWDVISRPSITCLTIRDSHSPGFKPKPAARPLTAANATKAAKVTTSCLRMTVSPTRSQVKIMPRRAPGDGERVFDAESADRGD